MPLGGRVANLQRLSCTPFPLRGGWPTQAVLWLEWGSSARQILPRSFALSRNPFALHAAAQAQLTPEKCPTQAKIRLEWATCQPPVWIDQVLHRAVAEVNEEGTEAAAATAITQCLSARNQRPPRHFQMIVDRPFFVVIRDETSGTILFMGWVGDPGCAAPS